MRLWWAQLISQFGDRLNQMALIGLVAERADGSAWDLAKLLAFTIFPVFIVGPVAGAFVDRWDRRKTLFVCDILRGFLVLLIPYALMHRQMMLPIYGVVFLIFCFSRFYVPAKMSIIPDLVEEQHLSIANSLMTTTGMIAFVLGCALGGFLVDRLGARGGFIGDAFTFFISGALIFSIRRDLVVRFNPEKLLNTGREIIRLEQSVFADIKDGWRYLFHNRDIRFVIIMLFILLAAAGAVYVVIIVFIQQTFQSVTRDLGLLAVMLGIGLFSGALGYGKWGRRFTAHRVIFSCLIAGGLMMTIFTVGVNAKESLAMAAALSVGLGMVLGPIFIASNTLVLQVADEQMRGKTFSALEIVIHFAFLTAMLLSSVVAERVGPFWILISVGVIFAGVGVVGFLFYKRNKS